MECRLEDRLHPVPVNCGYVQDMWVHKKEVQYHHVSSSESTSSKWTVITHSQKMAMKCSTWKTVLFLLAIVFVVQFTLQLRIAYLENSYTKSGGRGEPVFDFQKAFNLVIATTNKVRVIYWMSSYFAIHHDDLTAWWSVIGAVPAHIFQAKYTVGRILFILAFPFRTILQLN